MLSLHSPVEHDSNTNTVDQPSPEPTVDYAADEPPGAAVSASECDPLECMRRTYMASLDASIDLLVRNTIAFPPAMFGSAGAAATSAAQPSAFTALGGTALPPMSATVQHHWHKPQPHVGVQQAASPGSSRSAQFTIENLIRKDD